MQYWYVDENGNTAGPVDEKNLMELRSKGQIDDDTDVVVAGGSTWDSLANLLDSPSPRIAPVTCPYCRTQADSPKACPSCGTPHHHECWQENKGCTVYGCSEAPSDEPGIVITNETLAHPHDGSSRQIARRSTTAANYHLTNRGNNQRSYRIASTAPDSSSYFYSSRQYGGIGRSQFFVIYIAFAFFLGVLPKAIWLGLIVMAILCSFRLKNIGVSRLLCLCALIPLLNIFLGLFCLLFQEGWIETKKLDDTGRTLSIILGFIFVLTIIIT